MCNDVDVGCGSYKLFEDLKFDLLNAVLKYCKNNLSNDKILISELEKTLAQDVLNYNQINNLGNKTNIDSYNLNGFRCIMEKSHPPFIDCIDAEKFMESYELVKEFVNDHFKLDNNKFYMYSVFEESIKSGEDITIG